MCECLDEMPQEMLLAVYSSVLFRAVLCFFLSGTKQAEGGGASRVNILVREGRHGRDEPSLGLRHSIDTTLMQVEKLRD